MIQYNIIMRASKSTAMVARQLLKQKLNISFAFSKEFYFTSIGATSLGESCIYLYNISSICQNSTWLAIEIYEIQQSQKLSEIRLANSIAGSLIIALSVETKKKVQSYDHVSCQQDVVLVPPLSLPHPGHNLKEIRNYSRTELLKRTGRRQARVMVIVFYRRMRRQLHRTN